MGSSRAKEEHVESQPNATRSVQYAWCIDILVLCTANICRSPIAEALLMSRIARRGLPATVTSAGLLAGGRQSPPEVVTVLASWGLDVSEHVSRQMTRTDLERADLVVGMERAHVREAVVLLPSAWPRTFTLKELVRRGAEAGARGQQEDFDAWLVRVHDGRERRDLLGDSPFDDIADPYGGTASDYETTLAEIRGLVTRLLDLLWPVDQGDATT